MNQNNINPQQLRIGNWVTLSGTIPMRIYEIQEDCFYAKDAKGGSFKNTWADIQPIPLSDEVLLKAGFEDVSSYKDYWLTIEDDLRIEIALRHGDRVYTSISDVGVSSDIKYLHQLQNLFYSLTQSELEINFLI